LRKLYDELGPEAVKASWQLGPYTGKYSEKQRILDALKHVEDERLQRFQAKAVVSSGLDVTPWFDDYSSLGPLAWYDYVPSASAMYVTQSFDAMITPDTSVELSYSLAAKNGTGNGTARLTVGHQLNPETRADMFITIGEQRTVSVGATRLLKNKSMLNGSVVGHLQKGMIFPILQGGISGEIWQGIHGSATALLGAQNALVLSASWVETDRMGASTVTLHLSPNDTLAKYKSSVRIKEDLSLGFKLKLAPQNNTSVVSIGLDKVWSPLYTSAAYVECDMDEGVCLALSLTREDTYTFTLPVKLSAELTPSSILIGAAAPAVLGFLFERYILAPLNSYFEEKKDMEKAGEITRILEGKKMEAFLVADILQPAYEKRRQAEQLSNGLIVQHALYSALSGGEPLDVTAALQVLILDSQLLIEAGRSKSSLLGFYDLAPGAAKKLTVEYMFKGQLHRAVFDDNERVILPQRHHKV